MEKVIADADQEILVELVRLTQKQGMKGSKGGWKEFLDRHDRKFGARLGDPAKRSADILVTFLKTFTQESDLKFFRKMIRRCRNLKALEQFNKDFPGQESPQQMLVHLTMENRNYAQQYCFPSHEEEWIIVPSGKISKAKKSKTMISVDCEMVLCEDGTEAVVKVCAVDHNLEVKLDKLVNPNKGIADYRTSITGMSSKDLEGVSCSLVDIQKSLKKLLSHGTILVGHSLHNDLRALRIDHPRVVDTSYIFKCIDLPAAHVPSLNNLCQSVLGFEIRKEGEPHNCLVDAQATMKLVLAKLEHGFNDPIAIAVKNVSYSDQAKLLLHKIPVGIPTEELLKLFPADYNINIQSEIRVRGQTYTTFADFEDATEADEAFRGIDGQESKDTSGRVQKRVFLKLSTGRTVVLYIRKMTTNGTLNNDSSKKRSMQDEITDLKRQKIVAALDETTYQCNHAQEIENLRQELCQREEEISTLKKSLSAKDKEIFSLQKILAALTRKHGL